MFQAGAGTKMKLELKAKLTAQDPIRFVEIIKNGRVERRVPFTDVMKTGALGTVDFKESGWFLVRVIADNKNFLAAQNGFLTGSLLGGATLVVLFVLYLFAVWAAVVVVLVILRRRVPPAEDEP